ncbi:hypothetical protein STAL104432_07555 [Streptomyces albus]
MEDAGEGRHRGGAVGVGGQVRGDVGEAADVVREAYAGHDDAAVRGDQGLDQFGLGGAVLLAGGCGVGQDDGDVVGAGGLHGLSDLGCGGDGAGLQRGGAPATAFADRAGEVRQRCGAPAGDQDGGGGVRKGESTALVPDQCDGPLGDLAGARTVPLAAHRPYGTPFAHVRLGEQPPPELVFEAAPYRAVQSFPADLAGTDGVQYGAEGGVQLGGEDELVAAGLEGADGGDVGREVTGRAAHVEGVGRDEAVETELLAQQPRHDRVRHGGRYPGRVERGHHDVGCHDRVDSAPDGGPERGQVDTVQLRPRVLDLRQPGVAVHVRVAVPGEVFGRAGDTALVVTAYSDGHVLGAQPGIRPERANPDDRVRRVHIDVRHRRVVLVDADGGEFGADDVGAVMGVARGAGRGQRHVARQLCGGLQHPVDDAAALLVDGDQQRDAGPAVQRRALEAVRQSRDLARFADVVGSATCVEVDDAARPVLLDDLSRSRHPVQFPVPGVLGVRRLAVDLDDEQLADLLLQAHPAQQGRRPRPYRGGGHTRGVRGVRAAAADRRSAGGCRWRCRTGTRQGRRRRARDAERRCGARRCGQDVSARGGLLHRNAPHMDGQAARGACGGHRGMRQHIVPVGRQAGPDAARNFMGPVQWRGPARLWAGLTAFGVRSVPVTRVTQGREITGERVPVYVTVSANRGPTPRLDMRQCRTRRHRSTTGPPQWRAAHV